jgi:hypothetical protein
MIVGCGVTAPKPAPCFSSKHQNEIGRRGLPRSIILTGHSRHAALGLRA